MQLDDILKSYERYAPVYDRTFGWMLGSQGRALAAALANARPGRVLEVGVGTGIGLRFYRPEHEVHGIDVSPSMLERARQRVRQGNLAQVAALEIMDAGRLCYQDGCFDAVVAAYVMSVVPDPRRVMGEIERVCKRGGSVVIVNHFRAEKGVRRGLEACLAPLSAHLGWRPDMPIEDVLAHTSLREIHRQTLPPLGLFTLLHLRKEH
jgi:phosphatidylethanolamine/phosphatidyl-N-methylethanolamine N-methyltransferase